ncbi:MAG: DUF4147 domain-containing protein [Thermoplasmataceae archaeon]
MVAVKNAREINTGEKGKFLIEALPGLFDALSPENSIGKYREEISSLSESHSRIFVVGFGKAAYNMYAGIRKFLKKVPVVADIIVPDQLEIENTFGELRILRGTHPETSVKSEQATEAVLSDLDEMKETDIVFVLISGGGSSLFEKPETGFNIDEISRIGKCMMLNGADIREMNAVRGAMSAVKSGKFAALLYPATVKAYIISDVIGDDIAVIASGPLNAPSAHREFINGTITKYSGLCGYSAKNLISKANSITGRKYFNRVSNTVVLRNHDFVTGLSKLIEDSWGDVTVLGSDIGGEVNTVSGRIADACRVIYDLKGHGFWLIFGGETTVRVAGEGKGGRNQELAVRIALEMKPGEHYTIMAIGTDGIDGKSPAMGGIIDENSMSDLKNIGIEPYLSDSDSYTLLSKGRSALVTGFTGTNVSDICAIHYNRD